MEKKVSIIIPTYNRKKAVSKCLESLSDIPYDNYEIIVIDDASEDSTVDYIKSRFNNIIIIRNTKRKGPAYAKNQGLLKSTGQFIWFLDSDSVVLDKNCLNNMINACKKNPKIGCIGGELIYEDETYLVRINGKKIIFNEEIKQHFNMVKVRSLTTANLFTKKNLLFKIGGFDNNYFYMAEDVDICFKIHALGYDIVMDCSTLVLHRYVKDFRKSNFYLLFRNEIKCALINYGVINGFLEKPFHMIYNLVYMLKSKIKSTEHLSDTVHIISSNNKEKSKSWFLFCMAIKIMIGFIFAYSWNVLFLYKTIYIDKKTNHLKKIVV